MWDGANSLIDLFLILANKQQNGVLGLHPFKNEALVSTRFVPSPLARRWVLHRLHTRRPRTSASPGWAHAIADGESGNTYTMGSPLHLLCCFSRSSS